jgi:hypothetical protein
MTHRTQNTLARLGGVAWHGLRVVFLGATLCGWLAGAATHAGVTLTVNGVDTSVSGPITVNAGDPLVFSWTATEDVQGLARNWGDYADWVFPGSVPNGTSARSPLPANSGSEKVRAFPSADSVMSIGFSVIGTDSAGNSVGAAARVTVLPSASLPAFTPVVWNPPLGTYHYVSAPESGSASLDFYVVPDAQVGVPYSAVLVATGVEPITYGAVGLPEGLALSGNTVSGIPGTATIGSTGLNKASFWITATDADGFMSVHHATTRNPISYPRMEIPLTAPVVADSGAPALDTNWRGAHVDNWRFASGFTLRSSTTVTGIRVWGAYGVTGKADGPDAFTIKFYESGPSPIYGGIWPSFPAVGNLIGTYTPTSVKSAKTGRAALGFANGEYVHDLSFMGVSLAANTRYFVSVHNANNRNDWWWSYSTAVDTTTAGTAPNGHYAFLPTAEIPLPLPVQTQTYPLWIGDSQDGGITWTAGSASYEMAFQLSDGPVVVTPPPTAPTTYKLNVKTTGKGIVSLNPSAKAYAPGTVVTLTATPDATSVWKGWTGDVTSASRTVTVTINKNIAVQANFR